MKLSRFSSVSFGDLSKFFANSLIFFSFISFSVINKCTRKIERIQKCPKICMCEYQKHLANTNGHTIQDISSIENYRIDKGLEFLVVWKIPEFRPSWERQSFALQCQNLVMDFLHREEQKSVVRGSCIKQALINHDFPMNTSDHNNNKNDKSQENKIEKILGMSKQNRQDIYFSVLFKGQTEPITICNSTMKKKYPKDLIHFYESLITFTNQIHAPSREST